MDLPRFPVHSNSSGWRNCLLPFAVGVLSLLLILLPGNKSASAQVFVDLQHQVVASLSFSPDGKYLLSGGHDGTIRLWETASRRGLYVITINEPAVEIIPGIMSVAFSPDGQFFATAIRDRTVRLWNTETGQQIRIFSGHELGLRSVAFSPDGARLVSGSHDTSVRLWDLGSKEALPIVLGTHDHDVMSTVFSPDGMYVFSGGIDNTIRLWATQLANQKSSSIFARLSSAVSALSMSQDGHRLAAGTTGPGKEVHIFDLETKQSILQFQHKGSVSSLAFSPNGETIVSVDSEGDVSLRNARTGAVLWQTTLRAGERYGHGRIAFRAVAFSPQGNLIACGGDPGNPHLLDAKTGAYLGMLGE